MSKRYNESIDVEVEGLAASALKPTAFSWRGRRYSVQRLLKYWREAGEAWDPERVKDHEMFRVEADGGTYDLRHDRTVSAATGSTNSKRSTERHGKNDKAAPARTHWQLIRVWD